MEKEISALEYLRKNRLDIVEDLDQEYGFVNELILELASDPISEKYIFTENVNFQGRVSWISFAVSVLHELLDSENFIQILKSGYIYDIIKSILVVNGYNHSTSDKFTLKPFMECTIDILAVHLGPTNLNDGYDKVYEYLGSPDDILHMFSHRKIAFSAYSPVLH